MSLWNPTTWTPDSFLLPRGKFPQNADRKLIRKQYLAFVAAITSVVLLARFWRHLVIKHVPEPYLDEFFHIPQAQRYCVGDFTWDPKITTPPGLYVVSAIFSWILKGGDCSIPQLREVNLLSLCFVLLVALSCRNLIERQSSTKGLNTVKDETAWRSSYAVHTAANIALFPPLFFFSGLYYTDVLSTCVVLAAYNAFLRRGKEHGGTLYASLGVYGLGIMALLMRQTNIFWVAVFLAGLEWVRTTERTSQSFNPKNKPSNSLHDHFVSYMHGKVHDMPLGQATVPDLFWCAISIAVAAAYQPVLLIQSLWPYLALLLSFAAFVLWNGGVVLGDKSNHVATLHLSQMLYIWSFIAFFSLPLIYPSATTFLKWGFGILSHIGSSKKSSTNNVAIYAFIRYAFWIAISLAAALIIIRFNTIIHPFTLADNRHYVFYVFRYTIRRHYLIKYLLAPIYIICGLLVLRTTAGFPDTSNQSTTTPGTNTKSIPSLRAQSESKQAPPKDPKQWTYLRQTPQPDEIYISTVLIWLIATALSLITAPLVEPRYFIIPWIIWRLHVPSLPLVSPDGMKRDDDKIGDGDGSGTTSWMDWVAYWAYKGHDHRLWLETAWFLLVNAVTAWMFLFRGFEWGSEPGKVQRFMW